MRSSDSATLNTPSHELNTTGKGYNKENLKKLIIGLTTYIIIDYLFLKEYLFTTSLEH